MKSRTHIEWKGATTSLTDLARAHDLMPETLRYRLKAGWSLERALQPKGDAKTRAVLLRLRKEKPRPEPLPAPRPPRAGFPQLRALLEECEAVLLAVHACPERRRHLIDDLQAWKARC